MSKVVSILRDLSSMKSPEPYIEISCLVGVLRLNFDFRDAMVDFFPVTLSRLLASML